MDSLDTALYTPEDLLNAAQLGRKLKPKERKLVVLHLERTGDIDKYPEHTLARIFGCKIGSLKKLRQQARQIMAAAISADQAMDYMAEYVRHCDYLITEAKKGIKENDLGTSAHQVYMRLLKEVSGEKIEKLQSIGCIPKELGRLTTVKEEWKATVSEEGLATVTQVHSEE